MSAHAIVQGSTCRAASPGLTCGANNKVLAKFCRPRSLTAGMRWLCRCVIQRADDEGIVGVKVGQRLAPALSPLSESRRPFSINNVKWHCNMIARISVCSSSGETLFTDSGHSHGQLACGTVAGRHSCCCSCVFLRAFCTQDHHCHCHSDSSFQNRLGRT